MTTRSVVATLGPAHDKPWWWRHIDFDRLACRLDYVRLVHRGRFSQQIGTAELPLVMLKVLWHLLAWRRKRYAHVFTFECDLVGLSVAFWQSILGMRRPRHVIVQFIMRERHASVASGAKYALMRFLFRSVHRAIVSSASEAEYYRDVFGWPAGKCVFVPLLVSPDLVRRESMDEADFYLAAGRSFRDYDTLLRAVEGTGLQLVVVGGDGAASRYAHMANVKAMENIPVAELETLIQRSRAVVVPLHERRISTGQSVVLQAMALGKAVVATRTAGTVDYIRHMEDGVLVAPGDASELRNALLLLEVPGVRHALGASARARVAGANLPQHYLDSVCDAIAS